MEIEVNTRDILHALIANKIHSSKCSRIGMSDRAIEYYKRKCTCWVEADHIILRTN